MNARERVQAFLDMRVQERARYARPEGTIGADLVQEVIFTGTDNQLHQSELTEIDLAELLVAGATTVQTRAELATLPFGTVVRSEIHVHTVHVKVNANKWYSTHWGGGLEDNQIPLPAKVLR